MHAAMSSFNPNVQLSSASQSFYSEFHSLVICVTQAHSQHSHTAGFFSETGDCFHRNGSENPLYATCSDPDGLS